MLQRDLYASFSFPPQARLKVPQEKKEHIKVDSFEEQGRHQHLAEYLSAHKQELQYLELSGNSYSEQFMEGLAVHLGQCENLSHVNLNNIFVSRLNTEIPKALIHFMVALEPSKLTFLDLSNNAIAPNGCQTLSYFISQASNLHTLLLNNGGIGYQGAQVISKAIQDRADSLSILALCRNNMGGHGDSNNQEPGGMALAQAFSQCKALTELHISQNSLRGSLTDIIASLKTADDFQVLDIEDNHLNSKGSEELALLIKGQKNLRALNINDCNINEKMNENILEALDSLQENIKIEKLGYKYNELYEEQYSQQSRLLQILMRNKNNLKKVEISGNDFEEDLSQLYLSTFKKNNLPRQVLSRFESDDEDEEYCALEENLRKEIPFEELQY